MCFKFQSAPKFAAFESPQALRASVPTPIGPSGHFPLTGEIGPLCPRGAAFGALFIQLSHIERQLIASGRISRELQRAVGGEAGKAGRCERIVDLIACGLRVELLQRVVQKLPRGGGKRFIGGSSAPCAVEGQHGQIKLAERQIIDRAGAGFRPHVQGNADQTAVLCRVAEVWTVFRVVDDLKAELRCGRPCAVVIQLPAQKALRAVNVVVIFRELPHSQIAGMRRLVSLEAHKHRRCQQRQYRCGP